jgi:RimJ/RimL family protein N-acetyltransferase
VPSCVLSIDARNRASVGLARKLGFQKVATWRHEVRGLEDVYRRTS